MTKLADELERVALAVCQAALRGKQCPCAESGVFKCADDAPGEYARAAIAALRQSDAVPSDLVERLREGLLIRKGADGSELRQKHPLGDEAAAAIQSLAAERDAALARVAELEKCVIAADKLCDATVRLTNASSALLEGSKP